jgi:hypothetical protein
LFVFRIKMLEVVYSKLESVVVFLIDCEPSKDSPRRIGD